MKFREFIGAVKFPGDEDSLRTAMLGLGVHKDLLYKMKQDYDKGKAQNDATAYLTDEEFAEMMAEHLAEMMTNPKHKSWTHRMRERLTADTLRFSQS